VCDPITCREILGKPMTYFPEFKLWFQSNYQPTIKGQDWGIWRRVKMIPWEQTIDPDKADEKLPEKLRTEAPGVVNWMLRGLRSYLEFGMIYPAKVEAATSQYRDAMDIIGRFVAACCIFKASATAVGSELYAAYVNWCKANGEFPMKRTKFDAELRKKYPGIKTEHTRGGAVWGGIGILVAGHYPEPEDVF
jgi:putative DNA primase/helicase